MPKIYTPYPWLVRIIHLDEGGPAFGVYEHTHPAIAVDREFWPDQYHPPTDANGYFQLDKYAGVSENRIGVALLIKAIPDMHKLLEIALRIIDEYFPAKIYSDDPEPFDETKLKELYYANRREDIRRLLAYLENPTELEEPNTHLRA